MKMKFINVIMIVILAATVSFSQDFKSDVTKRGTTAAQFLNISQGARATAMGSAFVGVADDPSAIYWNPAGIAKLQGFQMSFDHTSWFADINYNFVAATYNMGDMGAIGFSFTTSNYGDMKVTTIDEPNGTGEVFTASDGCFSLTYAINLTDHFSIGFNPKVVYQSVWKMNATAIAVDMGVQYVTPFDGIILAMSISNFGSKLQLSGNSNTILYDSDPQSSGNNGKIPANLSTAQWALPMTFRVGLGYSPIKTEMHKLTVAVDALHPTDNNESVNIGAEYVFNDLVAVRAGYKSLFLDDTEESFALGFGLKQLLLGNVAIKVDYAYQKFGRFNDIQKFTVGVAL